MSLSASRAPSVPVRARIALAHSGPETASAYLRSSTRIWVCSGTGMPTVCRYIVINVDASLDTLVSADENCSHATTMTNPSSAPYTRPTQVKNGDNAPLCPSLTGSGSVRFASHTAAAATATAATRDRASSTHRPAIPKSPTLTPTRQKHLDTPSTRPLVAPRLANRPSAHVAGGREDGWILRVGAWALRSSC